MNWFHPWLAQGQELVEQPLLVLAGNSLGKFDDALDQRVDAPREETTSPKVSFSELIETGIWASLGDVFRIGSWWVLRSSASAPRA